MKTKIKGEELLKFPSVQNWLSSLEQSAKSRGKQELTLGAKRQRLGRLLEYVDKLNPDELLTEAQADINKAGQRLQEYFDKRVSEGIGWNTACTNLSFLRGFYTHNNLVFPKKWKIPRREVSKVSKRDSKVTIYDYDEENGKVIFQNGTLQHFVQNLNFRDQTIALSLLSTGADTTDLLKLKVGFVKDGKGKLSEKKRFFWNDNRNKDGIPFKTFFSEEATQFLKRYVEQERADVADEELLFVRKYHKEGVEVTEPLDVSSIAFNFRKSADKMGYIKDAKSSPFRPKRFRHLFRTACSNAEIDIGYINAMMGHVTSVSASYLEQNQGMFLKQYLKVEPFLTVFGVSKGQATEMTETITELKDEVALLAEGGQAVKTKTSTLESEVQDLKEKLTSALEYIYVLIEEKDQAQRKEAQEDFHKLVDELNKTHPVPKKVK